MTEANTPEKMNPTLKALWVEALRSGRYEQGKGYLFLAGMYCCLGVLADIHGCPSEKLSGRACLSTVEWSLPRVLFGFNDTDRSIQQKLESMNDGAEGERKHSFAEIADWIEANL